MIAVAPLTSFLLQSHLSYFTLLLTQWFLVAGSGGLRFKAHHSTACVRINYRNYRMHFNLA